VEEVARSSSYGHVRVQLYQPGPAPGEELQARSCSNGAIQVPVSSGNQINQGPKYYAGKLDSASKFYTLEG